MEMIKTSPQCFHCILVLYHYTHLDFLLLYDVQEKAHLLLENIATIQRESILCYKLKPGPFHTLLHLIFIIRLK